MENVAVDPGRADVVVAEQLVDGADVLATLGGWAAAAARAAVLAVALD